MSLSQEQYEQVKVFAREYMEEKKDEPDLDQALDCIINFMAAFDSPLARRKMSGKYVEEVREIGRLILRKYGRKIPGIVS